VPFPLRQRCFEHRLPIELWRNSLVLVIEANDRMYRQLVGLRELQENLGGNLYQVGTRREIVCLRP
jgi:hypothetical protein